MNGINTEVKFLIKQRNEENFKNDEVNTEDI